MASGSEATFISQRLQRSLCIPIHSVLAQVTGLNNAFSATPTSICEITLCSPLNTNYKQSIQAFILNSLMSNLPSYSIDPNLCLKNIGFTLSDTQFHKPEYLLTRYWEVKKIPQEFVVSISRKICNVIFQKTDRRNYQ